MTLSLYIVRRFLRSFGLVFAIFFGIMLLIDVVDKLRRHAADAGLGAVVQLSLFDVPASLYRILPLVTILAAIALFLGLARSSELVVVRAAGRSGLRFLVAPVLAALGLGLFAVAVLNPLVAGLSRESQVLENRLEQGTDSVLSVSSNGLWLRDGGPAGQTVIQADRTDGDGTVLHDATFVIFDAEGRPRSRIRAAEARLGRSAWDLREAKTWDLTAANPEMTARVDPVASLPSDLTPARIRDSFGAPSTIPIWDLPAYIARIEAAGFAARAHRVWFQMELAQPLLLAAMVLLAAGFTMRHSRFGRTGQLVLLAVLGGFAIFFLRNFAQVLGENGQIPVALAAWSPPVAATLASVGLLLHLEDG